jgi:hypothetical protein
MLKLDLLLVRPSRLIAWCSLIAAP